jgi:hypothetical protein
MSAETVARTIQLILAPVVMVTACAILLGGLLSHYATINDRLRALARERLDLLRQANANATVPDAFILERLQEIDKQIPDLLHRHRLERDAVLCVYCAVLVFLVTMLVIAIAAVANSAEIATAALIVFMGGTGILSWGVLLTAVEVRQSQRAVEYEVRRVAGLGSQRTGIENVD